MFFSRSSLLRFHCLKSLLVSRISPKQPPQRRKSSRLFIEHRVLIRCPMTEINQKIFKEISSSRTSLSFIRLVQKVLFLLIELIVVMVLKHISLQIPAGKFTAVVGASGSGKSTIIQLLERFYDPVEGEILLDGHDIRTLNLRHLRGSMSLVSQEPVLFATTIFENICHGYSSSDLVSNASD